MILRDYQDAAIIQVRAAYSSGAKSVCLTAPCGAGKCLAPGTLIMKFDGSIVPVESIMVGDMLMGPDSKSRTVLSTASGEEDMYSIVPNKGAPYVVNKSHVLSLKITKCVFRTKMPDGIMCASGDIVNISVSDYLIASKTFRSVANGWRSPVDFQPGLAPLLLEPYFLGIWLGDGHSRLASITTGDFEIYDYIHVFAEKHGCKVSIFDNSKNSKVLNIVEEHRAGRGGSVIVNSLKHYKLILNKHIPHEYKTSSRNDRLDLLAGILDTDGYWSGKGYELTFKSEVLMDDVIFIARSLGFSAYKKAVRKQCVNNGVWGNYFRCHINGPVDSVPCKVARKKAPPRKQIKDVLVTGIRIESVGPGKYFGFELSGDGLFLLGDFTVTHNTVIFSRIAELASAKGTRIAILVHRDSLLTQASNKLTDCGVSHGIIAPGHRKYDELVQVASIQTLVRRMDQHEFDLLIVDECHHAISPTYLKIISRWPSATVLGVTATPCRTNGKGLDSVFKKLVLGPDITQLIKDGYLVEPITYGPSHALDLSSVGVKMGDYDLKALADHMDNPRITGDAIEKYRTLCPGAPAMVFCVNVKHAEDVAAAFSAAGFKAASVDGKMPVETVRARIAGLADKSVQVLASCNIVSEGTDIPAVVTAIMLRPTKSLSLHIQQAGRALRPVYQPGHDLSTRVGRLAAIATGPKPRAIILDHAGNVFRFMTVDEPHVWSLEGRKKRKRKDEVTSINIRACPTCFAVHKPAPQCPYCGHIYPTSATKDPEIEAGDLSPIDKEALRRAKHKEVAQARDIKSLLDIARRRGYHSGWAYHVLRERRGN